MIALMLAAAALAAPVQRYAVVVGTNSGVRGDDPLLYAERDATRTGDVLSQLGGVRSEHVVTLKDVDADRVREALEDLSARIERRDEPGDKLLFFYYSGHADVDAMRLNGSELPFEELTAMLQDVPVDVRVLVMDACQSGELTRLKGATPAEPFDIIAEDRLDSEGIAIITSSSVGEDAQESDRLQGGVFTHHFLAGLQGAADESGDGRITLTEAWRYGRTETIRSTSKARFVQHPSYAFELRGQDDLVLTRVEDPGRSARLQLDDPGDWLVFDLLAGDGVTEVHVADSSVLVLPAGAYLLRLRQDGSVREQAIEVRRGETLALAAKDMTAVSLGRTVRKGLVDDRRAALAVALGGGATGAQAPGLGTGGQAHLGLHVDLEPLTVGARVVGTGRRVANSQLELTQWTLGADVSGIKKLDAGALSFGLGLRGGGDLVFQSFDTLGVAKPRQAVVGRTGPVVSIDMTLGRRALLTLAAATEIAVVPLYDPIEDSTRLESHAVPSLHLELARYVR